MRTMKSKWMVVLAGALLGLACGRPGDDDDDGNNPGSGSETLYLEVEVDAENTVINAQSADQFSTDFSVDVLKDNQPFTGAVVTITTAQGPVTLTENPPGLYTGSLLGYAQVFRLDVDGGADFISGVQLTGPAPHTFTAPVGTVSPPNTDLDVQWEPAGASQAEIETNEMSPTGVEDTGLYTIPATFVVGEQGEIVDDEVILRRTEQVLIAGGLTGSHMDVTVENRLTLSIGQ